MTGNPYDAARITLLEFDASVRAWPGMYFRYGQGDPRLPTAVLSAVAGHVLHPATAVAPAHSLSALVEITGDLAFTVTFDEPHTWEGRQGPAAGYFGALLGPEWRYPAAAAALSTRTVVEMWCGGRGFRQELRGIRPRSAPREFAAPAGSGTRWEFVLDTEYFAPGAALAAEPGRLDPCGPECAEPAGPGHVLVRVLRDGGRETRLPKI
ncbi:hypothetical protein [Streptomyces sp. NPDC026673]|uniref:hypothetical protein n=1 Tax=Streptomyces sp. NPDC026673 TaxID=3155724 RepID=UPI0034100581